MLTNDDIQQIGKLLEPLRKEMQDGFREVNKKIEAVDKKVDTVELKVEAVHEFNKKAHAETMETLLNIGEINYQELQKELKDLKKRVEQLEGRQRN